MMNSLVSLDIQTATRLCVALAHSIWVFAVIAGLVALLRRWPTNSVERQYNIAVLLLLTGIASVPIIYVAQSVGRSSLDAPKVTDSRPIQPDGPAPDLPPSLESLVANESELAPKSTALPTTNNSPYATRFTWAPVLHWLAGAYVVGVCLMLLRLLLSIWSSGQLARSGKSVAEGLLTESLGRLAQRLKLRTLPLIRLSERVAVPRIAGLFRPIVLLPTSAATGLTAEQLEMILAHELAHLRRHDIWVNLLQRIAEAALFFNPFLWIVSRQISAIREYCCDESACQAVGGQHGSVREDYAVALVRVAELSRTTADQKSLATLAATGRSPSELRRRVASLLNEPIHEPLRLTRTSLICLCIVGLVVVSTPLWSADEKTPETERPTSTKTTNDAADETEPTQTESTQTEPTSDTPVDENTAQSDGPTSRSTDPNRLTVVIAQHVMLLDGREIITWDQLGELVKKYPDPSKGTVQFYMTHGVHNAPSKYESVQEKIWDFDKKYNLYGHGEGGLWPRTSRRYDAIKSPQDLVPNEAHRIGGVVINAQKKVVADAEIIVIPPMDEADRNKVYHLSLVNGRFRKPIEHIYTRSDASGGFQVFRDPKKSYYMMAVHPVAGFALVDGAQFDSGYRQLSGIVAIQLTPWGKVRANFIDPETKAAVNLSTSWKPKDTLPEISITQYWDDIKRAAKKENRELTPGIFRFDHIPPIQQVTLSTSIKGEQGTSFSMPGVSVSLTPGETRRIPMGPLSEQQKSMLGFMRKRSEEASSEANKPNKANEQTIDESVPKKTEPAKKPQADGPQAAAPKGFKWMRVRTVDEAGKPVAGTRVSVSIWPDKTHEKCNQSFSSDKDGWTKILAPDPPRLFRVWTAKSDYVPLFAQWWPEHQADGADIPDTYKFTLPPGRQLGGIVTDADGQPIEGAYVEVMLKTEPEGNPPRLVPSIWLSEREPPGLNAARTDAQGRWSIDTVPTTPGTEVRIKLSHPDYVNDNTWGGLQSEQSVTMKSLFDKTAKVQMSRGVRLSGNVVDENGRPLRDAIVIWGEDPYFKTEASQQVRTSVNGDFTFSPIPADENAILTVIAEGWAPDCNMIAKEDLRKPYRFQLNRGSTLRFRVADEQGQPIANAYAAIQEWRGQQALHNKEHPKVLNTSIPKPNARRWSLRVDLGSRRSDRIRHQRRRFRRPTQRSVRSRRFNPRSRTQANQLVEQHCLILGSSHSQVATAERLRGEYGPTILALLGRSQDDTYKFRLLRERGLKSATKATNRPPGFARSVKRR